MKKPFKLTEDQEYCRRMLSEWCGGDHHLPPVHEFGNGICINFHRDFSTYDCAQLTYLVLMAHRDAIRIELTNGGPRAVKIIAHRRKPMAEGLHGWERHPTLDGLMEMILKMKGATP